MGVLQPAVGPHLAREHANDLVRKEKWFLLRLCSAQVPILTREKRLNTDIHAEKKNLLVLQTCSFLLNLQRGQVAVQGKAAMRKFLIR